MTLNRAYDLTQRKYRKELKKLYENKIQKKRWIFKTTR